MADILSILASSYAAAPTPSSSKTKYVPVDPTLYTGTWKGTYSDGEKLSFSISNVQGFRAQVKFQIGTGLVQFQDVLIKDNSFRIGDTKFLLKKVGHATIKTVVTNPATGATVVRICGSTPSGPLTVTGSTGLVLIGGDAATGPCAGNAQSGPVDLTNNRGGVEFNGNSVSGPLTISGTTGTLPPPDTGSLHASGNTVSGPTRFTL